MPNYRDIKIAVAVAAAACYWIAAIFGQNEFVNLLAKAAVTAIKQ